MLHSANAMLSLLCDWFCARCNCWCKYKCSSFRWFGIYQRFVYTVSERSWMTAAHSLIRTLLLHIKTPRKFALIIRYDSWFYQHLRTEVCSFFSMIEMLLSLLITNAFYWQFYNEIKCIHKMKWCAHVWLLLLSVSRFWINDEIRENATAPQAVSTNIKKVYFVSLVFSHVTCAEILKHYHQKQFSRRNLPFDAKTRERERESEQQRNYISIVQWHRSMCSGWSQNGVIKNGKTRPRYETRTCHWHWVFSWMLHVKWDKCKKKINDLYRIIYVCS